MKIAAQNKTMPRLIKYLEANPDCSINDIISTLEIPRKSVEHNISMLMRENQVYISGYERPIGSGKAARLFTLGQGENIQLKRTTIFQKRKSKTEWQRKKRATKKILTRAKESGVFGVVIAQLERK